ncbi:VOC family protein [Geobacter sp. FeAm09]|uniref:VOC family protein n=1 Tax=Geobacter sp. FeAm09 TaxID=2597769 RepID=UPI0011ECDDB6|nr:VOC family protein [Geobacter sp. FeAm09]QEM67513.1 VOC family protein [Geobacter sp. FeAm09]
MNVKPIPEGYHSVTPYLAVPRAAELLEFMKRAFQAREKERIERPDGSVGHAEVIVGDSVVMLGEPKECGAMPAALYLYVPDVHAVYLRALEAGATAMLAPVDQFWGDRMATVEDPFGNIWHLATRVEEVAPEELQRRMAEFSAS